MPYIQCGLAGVCVHTVTQGQRVVDPPLDMQLQDHWQSEENMVNYTLACQVCTTNISLATGSHMVISNLQEKYDATMCGEGGGK